MSFYFPLLPSIYEERTRIKRDLPILSFNARILTTLFSVINSVFCQKNTSMKQDIHPNYYAKATITCACGVVLETGSTVESMHTEICAFCHPLYTGKKKVIDTTGRVDRFKKMAEKSQAKQVIQKKAPETENKKTKKKVA